MTPSVPPAASPDDGGPTLRPRTAGDDPELVGIFVAAWQHGYPGVVPGDVLAGVDEPTVAGWFADWRDTDALTTLVAEIDGAVVGFARHGTDPAEPDPRVGYLAALYVHPDAAGRGVGRALLAAAVDAAADAGRAAVTLWVFARNAAARGLYSSAGFVPDGARLTDPRWRTPQIRMRRELAG